MSKLIVNFYFIFIANIRLKLEIKLQLVKSDLKFFRKIHAFSTEGIFEKFYFIVIIC